MASLTESIVRTTPAVMYFAGAIELSLSINAFTSAYGTVPAPINKDGLILSSAAAFVSATLFSALGWWVETRQRKIAGEATDLDIEQIRRDIRELKGDPVPTKRIPWAFGPPRRMSQYLSFGEEMSILSTFWGGILAFALSIILLIAVR